MGTRILICRLDKRRYPSGLFHLLFTLFFVGLFILPGQTLAGETFRIVSQNMNRLFDSVDDGNNEKVVSENKFQQRVSLTTNKLVSQFGLPEIIAVQEVENLNVLGQIAAKIHTRTGLLYQALLLNGNDSSGINLGYLIHPEVKVKSVKQLFRQDLLKYDKSVLFSRPPLLLQACIESSCISLLNLHLRSMRGLRTGSRSQRVQQKRLAQARAIGRWIDNFQRRLPQESLMVLGDFNALTPSDPIFDLVGAIRGDPDNSSASIMADDWVEDDLIDLTRKIPEYKRYSYIYKKKKQILDYMLINTRFKPRLRNIAFTSIDYQFSDHAGLIAEFDW